MSDDIKNPDSEVAEVAEAAETDKTDHRCVTDFTQVASLAQGGEYVAGMERRCQSLRAKLEREKFERKKRLLANPFIATFRNLFGASRH